MANINVTYEEMRTAGTRLTGGKAELETKLTELKSMISNLIGAGFVTDQASVAFGETYEKFTQGAVTTITALDGLSGFLTQAADAMQTTDQSLAAGIRS